MASYKDDGRANLEGSSSLNLFRRLHKGEDKALWSTDIDFAWVEKNPYRVIAILELKNKDSDTGFTFAESILYKLLLDVGYPIYLVRFRVDKANDAIYDIDVGFVTKIDPKPDPPEWAGVPKLKNATWCEFINFETTLRKS